MNCINSEEHDTRVAEEVHFYAFLLNTGTRNSVAWKEAKPLQRMLEEATRLVI